MKGLLTTLVCAFAVLTFAAGAWAQNDEAEVDWDEAIEFAEVTDTYVENGVEWETYYDELQGVMWSQPADASREAVLAYHQGDLETARDLGLDCSVYWPIPEYLSILAPSSGFPDTYTSFNLTYSGEYVKRWEAVSWGEYDDVDGYVTGVIMNRTNYCYPYQAYVWDQDTPAGGGSGNPHWDIADDKWCQYYSSFYHYSSHHYSTVEDWEYLDGTTTAVTGHAFSACGATRVVYVELTIIEPEK